MEESPENKPKRKRSGEDLTWVTDKTIEEVTHEARARALPIEMLYNFPWWALILLVVGLWVAASIRTDGSLKTIFWLPVGALESFSFQVWEQGTYSLIFSQLKDGILTTFKVSFISYGLALVIGLIIGVIRSQRPRPRKGFIPRILSVLHAILYHVVTLFVEIMRGLPVLIVLLIFAFVIIPEVKTYMREVHDIQIQFRSTSIETAIIALAMTYGAFLSEVFRAGIQSIGKGQIEAAQSVGMTYMQTMRFIVLPQAVRRVLPPLGNDFIAMIKDSSLVAILGIRDVTQIAKVYSGSTFKYLETYLTVAIIYLTMTILGSILVKFIENQVKIEER